jgi:hypothetical protein
MACGRPRVFLVALLALVCANGAVVIPADRPARIITPDGSPIWIDPQRSFFFDAPSLSLMVHNEHSGSVTYALRIWIFDERWRLKRTLDYCTFDALGRATRGRVFIPLEAGLTLRDRAVVTISSAASGSVRWSLREDELNQLDAALASAKGSTGRLSMDRIERDPDAWSCPCSCAVVEALCDRSCGATGRAASSCTRTFEGGCAASCTCK